jgi:hypothetical protein
VARDEQGVGRFDITQRVGVGEFIKKLRVEFLVEVRDVSTDGRINRWVLFLEMNFFLFFESVILKGHTMYIAIGSPPG